MVMLFGIINSTWWRSRSILNLRCLQICNAVILCVLQTVSIPAFAVIVLLKTKSIDSSGGIAFGCADVFHFLTLKYKMKLK